MNYLNIRIIINGKEIHTLIKDKPVLIPLSQKNISLVATDGFHITKPLELEYQDARTYHLKVVCAIDDDLMYVGMVLILIFAIVGIVSDIALFRLVSFAPILYFLFYYYINRREFLQIKIL